MLQEPGEPVPCLVWPAAGVECEEVQQDRLLRAQGKCIAHVWGSSWAAVLRTDGMGDGVRGHWREVGKVLGVAVKGSEPSD